MQRRGSRWWSGTYVVVGLVLASVVFALTIGMAAWMAVRRHGARQIAEMSVAMCAPFVLLLAPYGLGLVSGDTVVLAGTCSRS